MGLLAFIAVATFPAVAQQGGTGGAGDYGPLTTPVGVGGGPGGSLGNDGGVGGRSSNFGSNTGGGGGGGGAVDAGGLGGAGGAGGMGGLNNPLGGAGGVAGLSGFDYGQGSGIGGGQNGTSGAGSGSASGGGGGGGGFYGATGAPGSNAGAITGGQGGAGGAGGVDSGSFPVVAGGGGGGGGGFGLIFTGAAISNLNSGTITGGAGGAGGEGVHGGNGGDGGTGILFTVSGASLNNRGTITGGNGGAGGAKSLNFDHLINGCCTPASNGGNPGASGVGGAGIVGAGLIILNDGTIAGGAGLNGQGNAISFTGGANTLTSNGTLTGNLGLANGVGATLTFQQTAAAGATGDAIISGITGLSGAVTDASVMITTDNGYSVTLGGNGNYSGGTTVTDGSTVVLSSNAALGTGTLTMGAVITDHTTLVLNGNGLNISNTMIFNSDPVITVATGNTNTLSGNISGAGDIVLNGGGTLVLSGANTYAAGTTLCGTVCGVAGGSSTLRVGVNTVGTPGAITSSAIGTGTLTFDGGTLQAGGNFTVANTAQVNSTGGAIDSNGFTFTYSGVISDAPANVGGLTVRNSTGTTGVVVLSGNNTFSGGTTLAGGSTLRVGVNTVGAPGAITSSAIGTGILTFDGGTLQAGGNFTVANATQINSSGGTIDGKGFTFTHSGVIADTPGNTGRLTIKDSTGLGLTRSVVLSGNNTYSGGTTLASGILTIGADSVFNTPGDPSSGIVSSAIGTGTLTFGNATLQAGGNFTVANEARINGNARIDANGYTFTYAGNISDDSATPARVQIADLSGAAGTVVLSGINTYSGGTSVMGASVQVNNSNAVGTGTVTLYNASFIAGADNLSFSNNFEIDNYAAATSTFDNGGMTLTLSGVIADGFGSGVVEFDGSGTTILTGNNTYTGGTTICACSTLQLGDGGTTGSIVGDVVNDGAFAFNRSDSASTPYVFAGVISGGGAVNQIGSGSVELSGANTYSGGTTISNGTVRVTNSDPGTSSSVGTGTVTLDGGRFQAGANNLDFSNAFAVNTTGGTIDTNGNTLTISGTIADGNGVTGILTKSGAGTLILTGSNSWSGGTALNAGTLSIHNGDAIGTGDLAMAEGTTLKLDGSFTLNNNINIAGDPIFDVTTGNTVDIAGVISDAPFPAPPGILEKIGGGTLVLSNANTYSGGTVISAGILRVTNDSSVGTGTVTLDGGTFQTDGAGDLAFTNNFKVNTTGGTVDNNGIILTLSGVISNGNGAAGALQITDTSGGFGMTVLSGVNTYSGGTLVSGTTLQVTNNSSVGSGTVTLDNGLFMADGLSDLTFTNNFRINNTPIGSAIDANGIVLTLAGNITDGNGPGALTISDFGGGRVIMTGTNTYSGGTTICFCATLQLGTLATMGSMVGAIINEGAFDIVNADTSGITSITTDGGFTTFYGNNTAGTATLVNTNGGATVFLDTSSAGSANISNTFGGTTLFGTPTGTETSTAGNATIDNDGGGTIFVASTNAGSAHITNRNGGGTIFGDQASASSAVIINNSGGATSFGQPFGTDTPTAGNATITNNSGGATAFNAFATAGNATITTNSGAFTTFYDNSTGGNAQFIANGTGFVDFGSSVGLNGDGRITAGSIAGSGSYYIGGGNTLVVGSNNLSSEVSGVIADFDPCGCGPAGSGALTKVGTGNLILSGVNTYTGATVVDGGRLSVNSSILSSSSVTVNAGGTLGGNGIVGDTVINGGALAPGNSIGLLTVQGSLVFTAAASYMVEVSPTNADRTNVIGAATLGGATVSASFAAGTYVEKRYTILNATGGLGGTTFSTLVNTDLPANFKSSLSYDASNVYLNLELAFVPPPGSGLNVNQQNAGNAIVGFFNRTGGIPLVFGGLTPNGLSQVSGETATGSQQATFDAMNIFLGLLTDPFVAGRDGFGSASGGATPFAETFDSVNAYAAKQPAAAREAFAKFATKAKVTRNDLFDSRWSVWGAAYGGGSSTDGNAALGSNNATARAFGFVAGADYRISPATVAGFALAGGGTSFAVNGFGSGRSDLFQAGAFVRHTMGQAYVTAALAYAWQDVTTDRTVTVAGIDRLRAQFNANAWSGRVEGGYRYVTPWMGVTPYAAGQFTTYQLPDYAEQVVSGANTFALNYAARDVTASRSELGIRTDKSFAMPNGIFTLRGRAAWAHNFNTDRSITPVFQTLPGAAFVVNGASQARDAALTTASAEMKWLNGWSAAATFEGEFSHVTRSYAGKGVARYSW